MHVEGPAGRAAPTTLAQVRPHDPGAHIPRDVLTCRISGGSLDDEGVETSLPGLPPAFPRRPVEQVRRSHAVRELATALTKCSGWRNPEVRAAHPDAVPRRDTVPHRWYVAGLDPHDHGREVAGLSRVVGQLGSSSDPSPQVASDGPGHRIRVGASTSVHDPEHVPS